MDTKIRTTSRVIRILLRCDLSRICSDEVAEQLHFSGSTLRRRLHAEGTSYQELLNAVRQHLCEKSLSRRWLPGKCLAWELGFSEPNSFYRAFNQWTGKTYTQYKKELRGGSVTSA